MSTTDGKPHAAGRRFQERRRAAHQTRKVTADGSHTSVQTIARFELYGSDPSLSTLRRWADWFQVPISDIYDYEYDDGEATG